jgi:hypothetical protein
MTILNSVVARVLSDLDEPAPLEHADRRDRLRAALVLVEDRKIRRDNPRARPACNVRTAPAPCQVGMRRVTQMQHQGSGRARGSSHFAVAMRRTRAHLQRRRDLSHIETALAMLDNSVRRELDALADARLPRVTEADVKACLWTDKD